MPMTLPLLLIPFNNAGTIVTSGASTSLSVDPYKFSNVALQNNNGLINAKNNFFDVKFSSQI